MELVCLLVLGQGVIPDGSTCCSQAEELPCLGGGARQEPVADLAVVAWWTRVGHTDCRWSSGAGVERLSSDPCSMSRSR